jgi:NTP pyrophosphatase (non-canonical NTP hydrolase)
MSTLNGNAKSLADMTAEVDAYCAGKGWRKEGVTFLEGMALLHSEVSEAVEAWRQWGTADATAVLDECDPDREIGMPPKPEGVGSEFADVLIRLLDDCAIFGIDLEAEYERKMTYNRSRPYRHGGKRK